MTLKLEGAEELKRLLRQTPESIKSRVSGVIATSTFSVAARMRQSAPARTGKLSASITSDATGLRGRVFIGAYYWHFIEFGTVRMPARPFVRPAVEMETPAFERGIRLVDRDVERDFTLGRVA